MLFQCRDCKQESRQSANELSRRRGPRCPACGGIVDEIVDPEEVRKAKFPNRYRTKVWKNRPPRTS